MIFPCEKAVWYYLPQIRADLAIELVKTGITQSMAAKKLGVTPAAVSQYIHKKRGTQSPKSSTYKLEIEAAVKKMCGEEVLSSELSRLVCNCCRMLQKEEEGNGCGLTSTAQQ